MYFYIFSIINDNDIKYFLEIFYMLNYNCYKFFFNFIVRYIDNKLINYLYFTIPNLYKSIEHRISDYN